MMRIAALAAVTLLTGASFAFDYSNDFENPVGSEWSSATTSIFNGSTVLGRFSNDTATLTLNGLNTGDIVTLGFDLFILDSWDGNTGPGPDVFNVKIDGTDVLNTTFTNVAGYIQSYPNLTSAGSFARQTGADDVDAAAGGTLPNGFYGNSLYKFGGSLNPSFTAVATGSTMTFSFTGSGLQGVGDESWAIDNVNVSAAPVPEPATMLLIAAGAGGLMAARRRKPQA
jgi:hypothetical protein